MALTLDPILASAIEGQSRHPIIEILSQSMEPDIPFDGAFLTTETATEKWPNMICHSSGALAIFYRLGEGGWGSPNYMHYVYTDGSRLIFAHVNLPHPQNYFQNGSLCELTNGNIGIVHLEQEALLQNYYLYRTVIQLNGTVITSAALVESYIGTSYVIEDPFVIRLANGTYLMVYMKKTVAGPTYQIFKRTSADFLTWSAESAISISGLSSANIHRTPSLKQMESGDIWLCVAYTDFLSGVNEIVNIYYSISADNGANWGAAQQITDYDALSTSARHPILIERDPALLDLIFHEQSTVLSIGAGATGLCEPSPYVNPVSMHFDSVRRKLLVRNHRRYTGNAAFYNIVQVDVDTFLIDGCWSYTTIPGFDSNGAYADNEVAYHKTVNDALKTTLIPNAQNSDLKSLLQNGLTMFEQHLAHAERLAQQLGSKSP